MRDSTPPLSLPQMILVHTNTMKVALMPKPMTVVTKLVPEPNISNPKTNPLSHTQDATTITHKPQKARTTNNSRISTTACRDSKNTPLHRFFNTPQEWWHMSDKLHTWQAQRGNNRGRWKLRKAQKIRDTHVRKIETLEAYYAEEKEERKGKPWNCEEMKWNHSGFGVTQRMVVWEQTRIEREKEKEIKKKLFFSLGLRLVWWDPLHEVDPHRCWGF